MAFENTDATRTPRQASSLAFSDFVKQRASQVYPLEGSTEDIELIEC